MAFFRQKSAVYYRFLFSYILVFSLPVVVLGVLMYHNAVGSLKAEIELSNTAKLQQIQDIMDMRMRDLGNIVSWLSSDGKLTPYQLQSNPYNQIEAYTELRRYKAQNSLIEELFLYYRGSDRIYSTKGISRIETLLSSIYRFQHWNQNEFVSELNSLSHPVVRPAENVNLNQNEDARMLTFLYPLPSAGTDAYGTVMFLVRESKLTDLIRNVLGDFQGMVYVLDPKNQVLASQASGNWKRPIPLPVEAVEQAGVRDLTIRNARYSTVTVKSNLNGWTFVTLIPTDQFWERVIRMKSFIGLVLLFATICGIVLSLLLSAKQYRPIHNLGTLIKTMRHIVPRVGNEFELLHDTIHSSYGDNEQLRQQLHVQRPFVRDQLLLSLLKGAPREERELSLLLSAQDVKLDGDVFCVLLISLGPMPNGGGLQRRETAERLLSVPMFPDAAVGYGVELVHERMTAVIVSFATCTERGGSGDRQLLEKCARHLLAELAKLRLSPFITAGNMYASVNEISKSYIEAATAMEHRMRSRGEPLLLFDEIGQLAERDTWYPAGEQMKFVQSLKQGNKQVALEALQRMIDSIAGKEQSLLLVKCMSYDIINTLFRMMSDMRFDDYADRIRRLSEFQSLHHFELQLHELVGDICRFVEQSREHDNKEFRDRVLDLIHERYTDNSLNLEFIAGHFELSVSYTSKLIKDITGQTFTDYIVGLRIEECKHQLVTTDKSIKDIIVDVGYLDDSNFIRKFRKTVGVTPGEYRKVNAGKT